MPIVKNFTRQASSAGGDLVPVLKSLGGDQFDERTMELRNFFGIKLTTTDVNRSGASTPVDDQFTVALTQGVQVMLEYRIAWTLPASPTATGIEFGWNFPLSPAFTDGYQINWYESIAAGASTIVGLVSNGEGAPVPIFANTTAIRNNGRWHVEGFFVVTPTSSGNAEFFWGNCTDVTRSAGSHVRVTPV